MVKFDELNVFGFTLRTVVHGWKGISRREFATFPLSAIGCDHCHHRAKPLEANKI